MSSTRRGGFIKLLGHMPAQAQSGRVTGELQIESLCESLSPSHSGHHVVWTGDQTTGHRLRSQTNSVEKKGLFLKSDFSISVKNLVSNMIVPFRQGQCSLQMVSKRWLQLSGGGHAGHLESRRVSPVPSVLFSLSCVFGDDHPWHPPEIRNLCRINNNFSRLNTIKIRLYFLNADTNMAGVM